MGGEQAANVLLTVKREQLARQGADDMSAADQEQFKAPILAKYACREQATSIPCGASNLLRGKEFLRLCSG